VKTITVQVREDHIETLARTKPMAALCELIWNALDADANDVRVHFIENELEGLEAIQLQDNGHGLRYDDAIRAFQSLGGSWKRDSGATREQRRVLHGKYGKGRFRAFSLGTKVRWTSVYKDGDEARTFTIQGDAAEMGIFHISDPVPAGDAATGMLVEIDNPPVNAGSLRGVKATQEITDIFALYLRHYPRVKLVYDTHPIDPSNAEERFAEYDLGELVMENGERVEARLTVVEWRLPGKRGVYLCDADGFMRHPALPRLHFRGFSYSAYLKSAHIGVLEREGLLQAEELSADVRQLLGAARAKLREHFALREAEHAQDILQEWQEEELYPYDGAASNAQEETERRIFNIYATHLNQIFPDFAPSSSRNRRLILRLLQELVKTDPVRVARILDEIVSFPEEKEEEVRELSGAQTPDGAMNP